MNKLAVLGRVIQVLVATAGVILLTGWLIEPTVWVKPLSYLATVILPFVPDLFRLLKIKVSPPLMLAYEAFLVIAMVLGIDLDWYKEVLVAANGDSYYDKIVHFSAGILTVAAGQEFFSLYLQQSSAKQKVWWFQVLFLLGMVAFTAVGWECYEFLYDEICGGHMQELVKSGVTDTMWDMMVSLIGGIISIVCVIWTQETSAVELSRKASNEKN